MDVLLEREPEVAWELISDLLPESHSVSSRTSEPRWRPKPEIGVLTYGDVWRANEETIRRSLTAAHRNGERLADLTPNAAYWRPEDRAELRQAIEDFSANSQDQDQRGKLWHAIRAFLGEHRRYPDADWSLSEEELSPFEPHLKSLEPEDILERVSWVFDDDWSFDYRDAGASQTRREAVVAVSSELGIDGVLSLARRVKLPHVLGDVLVDTTTDDDMRNELLERCLGIDDQAVRRLGVAFVYGCQRVSGAEWSDGILTSARFAQWPASKQADFCLGLPVRPSTWKVVSNLDIDAQRRYWELVHIWLDSEDSAETAEYAIDKLVGNQRVFEAVQLVGFHPSKLSAKTKADVLRSAIERISQGEEVGRAAGLSHDFETIIGSLREDPEVPSSLTA